MSRSDALQGVAEFLAVAEQASFRRAAGVLGVTPAAVSQAVRALELRTGVALFHRSCACCTPKMSRPPSTVWTISAAGRRAICV